MKTLLAMSILVLFFSANPGNGQAATTLPIDRSEVRPDPPSLILEYPPGCLDDINGCADYTADRPIWNKRPKAKPIKVRTIYVKQAKQHKKRTHKHRRR
jgi:hypothetical protein